MVLTTISIFSANAQSKFSLQTGIGGAIETNLGDNGLRFSAKVSRQLGNHWNAFFQTGTFQMFGTNETYDDQTSYQEKRSLSTVNFDLGGSFFLLNKPRIRLCGQLAGSYRTGRQLWPEFEQIVNGLQTIYYTHEKLSEAGYSLGLDFSVRATEHFWIGLDAHCHNYHYFGEYLGVGLTTVVHF